MLLVSGVDKVPLYTGLMWNGCCADINILRNELLKFDFRNKNVYLDLGFYGITSELVNANVIMPNKKPKGGELTKEQKQENKNISKIRISVENAIAGIKSFFVCRTKNRFHYHQKTHESFNLCTSLYNFKKMHNHLVEHA